MRVFLLLLLSASALAKPDFKRLETLAGRLERLAAISSVHEGIIGRYPTVSHSLFAPLQLAAHLGPRLILDDAPLAAFRCEFADGTAPLVLEEAPRDVAIFRGYLVDDPLSRRFPSYALSRSARTFWFHDGTPGAQPKAFAFVARVRTEDAEDVPLVLQFVGELPSREREGAVALLGAALAHESPWLVPSRKNPLGKALRNRVHEVFAGAGGPVKKIWYDADWELLGGMDTGQRRGAIADIEVFDAPFRERGVRRAIEAGPIPKQGLTVKPHTTLYTYPKHATIGALPLWERALLASALVDERKVPTPEEGGFRFALRVDAPTKVKFGAAPEPSDGLERSLDEIRGILDVSTEALEAAHWVRHEIRSLYRDPELNGTFGPRELAFAEPFGFTAPSVLRLPTRVQASSLLLLERAGKLSRADLSPFVAKLWERLQREIGAPGNSKAADDNALAALTFLVPLYPGRFEAWYRLAGSWKTALPLAAATGDLPFFDRVLAKRTKADDDFFRETMSYTFAHAAQSGELAMLERVRRVGGKQSLSSRERALQWAVLSGKPAVVRTLLRDGCYRKTRPEVELRQAAERGYDDVLAVLLEERPQEQAELEYLLAVAAGSGYPQALRYLLRTFSFTPEKIRAARDAAEEEGNEQNWLTCAARIAG